MNTFLIRQKKRIAAKNQEIRRLSVTEGKNQNSPQQVRRSDQPISDSATNHRESWLVELHIRSFDRDE